MMNYVCAYEVVALFLIGLVTFFYHYKNWLPMYKNSFFSSILHILLVVIFFDIMNRMENLGIIELPDAVAGVLTLSSYIGVIISAVLFWMYYLAQTLRLGFLKNKYSFIMYIPAAAMVVFVAVSAYNGNLFLVQSGEMLNNSGLIKIFPIVVMFYIFAGAFVLGKNRKIIEKRQYIFMQISNIVMVCFVELYYVPQKKLMLIYYCVAALVIMYYLIIHNIDMYLVSVSGCFSMAGFKKVIEEKVTYKKSYYCISICISNMENMSNYCLEDEINQVHAAIVNYLRAYGGRHNVYHIHSSEYIIMVDRESEANNLFVSFRKNLPKTLRINDKNISMYYKFYIAGNSEAEYTLSEFMRIILSMKKIAMTDSLDREIVVYSGNIRERIEKELENIRTIMAMIESDECELECMPIYDIKEKDVNELEINPVVIVGDRTLSIEEVWEVSREIGCSRDTNIMFLKKILQFSSEEKLFERGIKHVRINMASFHVISESICEEYMSYINEYNINPDNIVFELFINEDIPEDVLAKGISYLRKRGLHVCWDQFGTNACDLKNFMEMPFDCVKINNMVVSMYCNEKSTQLIYIIRMFRERGWIVCLDGVRYPDGFEMVKKMDVDYIQGRELMKFVPEDKIREFLLKKGGILGDI